jgi:uncharacterized protein (DUF2147 family)
MKKVITLCAVLVFCAGLSFAADPVEGYWISIDEKTEKVSAGWEIYTQGGLLYGKILSIAGFPQDDLAVKCNESYKGFPVSGKVNQLTVVGQPWIFGLKIDKTGQWKGGNVIDPNDGKMYGCEITYRPMDGKKYKVDTLEMRGKIGPFGRSQFWQKATKEQASSLR